MMKDDHTKEDLYIQQETGKMVVNDLEDALNQKAAKKKERKTKGYGADSDTDSDDEKGVLMTKG